MPQVIRNTGIDDIHLIAAQYRFLTGQDPITATGPTLTAISPSTKVAGAGGFTLTCTGTGFVSGRSQIFWGPDPVPTTFVSATSITAAIEAAKVAAAGDVLITVVTGPLTTASLPFTITPVLVADEASAPVPTDSWLKADIIAWLLERVEASDLEGMTKAELLVLVDDVLTPV